MSIDSEIAELYNLVGGQSLDAKSGDRTDVLDPCTGEVIATAPLSRWEDVDHALHTAAAAFPGWARTTPAQRQDMLLALADELAGNAGEIVNLETANTGKPLALMRDVEFPMAVDLLRFYAGAARVMESPAATEYVESHTSFARREPIGVCAQATTYTYPLVIAVSKVAPALAAGNSVVLKPAESTPMSALFFAKLAREILPAGVFNIICGDRDSGRAMVAHEIPGMFSITGTVRHGMEVAGSAAADLKRAHLQLGGKSAAVVFDDADLARAVDGISRAAFYNAGQDCTSATRVLASPGIYEELTAGLVDRARGLGIGPPQDTDAYCGPLGSAEHLDEALGFIQRLPEHAEVRTGGHQVGEHGFFFAPTVISGMQQENELVQHELLAPVITVQRIENEAEAVECANGVRYGMAASVWTRDHARAMRMSRSIEAGTVWINTHRVLTGEMPHSGFKHSASARDFGRYGLEEYSRVKHVMSYVD